MRTRTLGGAILLGAAALVGVATPAVAQGTGTVYVVHGIPDLPVDVYVDGERAIDDFQPGTSAGPVNLPAGARQVAIFPADAEDDSGTPALSGEANVPAGGNVTLVAHLSEAGAPTLTPFVNDVATLAAGKARIVVRHTAAAPAVDVRANGTAVLTNVTNPNQGALVVDAGTIAADVTLAGTDTVVIGPANVTLAEGTATFVHAIGSAEDENLSLVSFVVTGLHSPPQGVPAGSDTSALAGWLVLGFVVAAGAGVALVTRRRVVSARTGS